MNGTGDLSFYGPATSAVGASGNWTSYSATLTGSPAVQISTNALTLNGNPLPQGIYTITASLHRVDWLGKQHHAELCGIGIADGNRRLGLCGAGQRNVHVGRNSPCIAHQRNYAGRLRWHAERRGKRRHRYGKHQRQRGQRAGGLALAGLFTTNQNTPVTFATALTTSLADTYTITAEAPPGWTVSMDANGNATATPGAGLAERHVPGVCDGRLADGRQFW